MKKLYLAFMMCLFTLTMNAETVKIKAGTVIPVRPLSTIYGKNAEIGQQVKFRTTEDVKVNNQVVVPNGTIVYGKVANNRKATIAGTKGILTVTMDYLVLDNGDKIYLGGDITSVGKNKTPLAVTLGVFVWPCIFIPGTNAVMLETTEGVANVANTIEVEL